MTPQISNTGVARHGQLERYGWYGVEVLTMQWVETINALHTCGQLA